MDLGRVAEWQTRKFQKLLSERTCGFESHLAHQFIMSYDFDNCINRDPPIVTDYVGDPKDLEVIVTLLQLAAIFLTPNPGVTFTFEQLFSEAKDIGGNEISLDEKDVKIVLVNFPFFKKEKGGLYSLK